jgi:copper(I)-binding protein
LELFGFAINLAVLFFWKFKMKFITKFAINSLLIALSPWLLSGAVHAQAVVPSIKAESASKSSVTHANVTISDSWVRPTVAGQKATGAFMKITAKENSKLLSVSSPVAGVAEVHEMKMEKDVMKMAAIPSLDLPAGKAVELKPGSYHIMLMDLKSPVEKGAKLPLTLKFQDARGGKFQVELLLDATMPMASGQPSGAAKHLHH